MIPNVLASALQALEDVTRAAEIGLQSLKDNPTFLGSNQNPDDDLVVSSGGYHDHRAAKAIDQVNSVMVDLCVLAARQVDRFLDGQGLGLPPLLAAPEDRIGMEFLSWTVTEPLTSARAAAAATTLDIGGHDPAGNQSDISSLAFIAYAKHLVIARAFGDCMASLAITAGLALDLRGAPIPDPVSTFCQPFLSLARAGRTAWTRCPNRSAPPVTCSRRTPKLSAETTSPTWRASGHARERVATAPRSPAPQSTTARPNGLVPTVTTRSPPRRRTLSAVDVDPEWVTKVAPSDATATLCGTATLVSTGSPTGRSRALSLQTASVPPPEMLVTTTWSRRVTKMPCAAGTAVDASGRRVAAT